MWVNGQFQCFNWTPTFGPLASSIPFYTFNKLGYGIGKLISLFLHTQRQNWLQGVKGLSLKEIPHCCNVFGSTACKVAYFTWGRYLCFPWHWSLVNYLSFVLCVWCSWVSYFMVAFSNILPQKMIVSMFIGHRSWHYVFREIVWTKQPLVLHVESGNRSHIDDVQRYALPSGFIVLGGVPDMPAFWRSIR